MEPMSTITGVSLVWESSVMFSLITSIAYLKASTSSFSSVYVRSPERLCMLGVLRDCVC